MQKKRTETLIKKSNGTSVGSFGSLNEGFIPTPEQSKEIIDNFKSIINTRLDKLYDTKGADGELYAYGIAVNQVKKKAEKGEEEPPSEETPTEEPMDKDQKLKEMIQAALSKPLEEKKKSFPDLTGDGKVTQADILKAKGVELDEDLDLGHQDDEPHMIKGELYKIAQNALALYKMLEPFDNSNQEVDLPAWWQSKITKACTMLGSAKSYLEFELKEPQIDAMVDIASKEGAINENIMKRVYNLAKKSKDIESFKKEWSEIYNHGSQDINASTNEFLEKIYKQVNGLIDEKLKSSMGAGEYIKDFKKSKAPQFKGKSKEKKRKMAIAAYLSKHPEKVKEAVVNHLKSKK